jgi:hypothetical protein
MTLFAATSIYWHLPVMIAVVSTVYAATRFDGAEHIFREAGRWAMRMVSFLFTIGAILYFVSTFL